MFSPELVKMLSLNLNFKTIGHENNVVFDLPDDPWLMYVEEGLIESYYEKTDAGTKIKGQVLEKIHKHSFFGLAEFVTGHVGRVRY